MPKKGGTTATAVTFLAAGAAGGVVYKAALNSKYVPVGMVLAGASVAITGKVFSAVDKRIGTPTARRNAHNVKWRAKKSAAKAKAHRQSLQRPAQRTANKGNHAQKVHVRHKRTFFARDSKGHFR